MHKSRYHVKYEIPLTDQEFKEGMDGSFISEHPGLIKPQHPGLIALLHYSGVRISEALRTVKEQGKTEKEFFFYDVGVRLKHGKETPQLPIPIDAPYVDRIIESFERAKPGEKVFPYCRKTGYNIVHRVFHYPHYHRLTRITWFFMPHPELNRPSGYSIAEVRSWTGLTLDALDYYIGLASILSMGASLRPIHESQK